MFASVGRLRGSRGRAAAQRRRSGLASVAGHPRAGLWAGVAAAWSRGGRRTQIGHDIADPWDSQAREDPQHEASGASIQTIKKPGPKARQVEQGGFTSGRRRIPKDPFRALRPEPIARTLAKLTMLLRYTLTLVLRCNNEYKIRILWIRTT
jgi:hypothetical protein